MADFDINGAKKAGYSDAEIASHLAAKRGFDIAGARKAGYSDSEILGKLSTAAPSVRENYNADPTWFDKINEGATGNILAPSQGRDDDPISRVVKGVGSSLERTTKAWADALSLNPSDTTAAEMIPLLGPAAVDAVRMMSTPGQGFQGIGAAGALLAPAVASEVAARPTAAPKPSPSGPRPPPPSSPVNVGGLMDMAKTGKDILQVLKSPNPLTKLSALGRLFEKFASEVTPIEAPPTPTVVEAPPVASGTPVRPPLRGKQFGTFNDPAAPPLPAGVEPSGPVRPPLQGRQFGTTVAKMMREEVPGRQFGTSSQSRLVPAEAAAAAPAEMPALEQITEWLANRDGGTASRFTDPVVSEAPITKQTLGDIMDRLMKNRKVPAEVPAATVPAEAPPAAVETPQPATPAPSAAGKPVTAATLMEEVAKPTAQVNNPNYDWRTPEGIKAAFKQYLKDSGFDQIPDRPEFDPTDPKAQGRFSGSAKTQVNMDAKANRFVEYLKANKLEPTPDNVARATQTLNEADHPSAHTLEKIYTQMGYDALDVEELLARSIEKVESPAASAAAKPPAAPKPSVNGKNFPEAREFLANNLTDQAKEIFEKASPDQQIKELTRLQQSLNRLKEIANYRNKVKK